MTYREPIDKGCRVAAAPSRSTQYRPREEREILKEGRAEIQGGHSIQSITGKSADVAKSEGRLTTGPSPGKKMAS
jgi:hypothetical protein